MADANQKPSFFSSVLSGIKGWAKGWLAGGVVGLALGAALGAAAGLVIPGMAEFASSTIGSNVGAVLGGATVGAATLAAGFSGIGSLAGMATEVVRSREAAQPSASDITNVAKISYAQGIATGHAIAQQQEAEQTTFRDKEMQRRAAAAAPSQIVH